MHAMLIPILIAAAVMTLAWGVVRVVVVLAAGEQRKLKERLSQEGVEKTPLQRHSAVVQEQGGMTGLLLRLSPLKRLQRRLQQAYPNMSLLRFLGLCAGSAFGGFMIAALFFPPGPALIALFIAGYVPVMVLNSRRESRQRAMTHQLPETLDFLCRILRAGHSFSTALQTMGQELPEPLGSEFRRCNSRHSLGLPLESALREMTTRIESSDFAFFVTAVLIQRQTGGDLTTLLTNIGDTVRQRIRMQQQVKSKTAEGRFSGYILVAFPVVMFVIMYLLNPQYVGVMLHDKAGIFMLAAAVVLQIMGLWSIRKITAVRA